MSTKRRRYVAGAGDGWGRAVGVVLVCGALVLLQPGATAADWPQWGRDASKNMASPDARGLPTDFAPGDDHGGEAEAKHIKWVAALGSTAYGNPTVANGRVYVGTNNVKPRDPKLKGDRSMIYCLDEATG